jgi:hypothetical protein
MLLDVMSMFCDRISTVKSGIEGNASVMFMLGYVRLGVYCIKKELKHAKDISNGVPEFVSGVYAFLTWSIW